MEIIKTTPHEILAGLGVSETDWTNAGMEFDSVLWVSDIKTTKVKWDAKRIELEAEYDANQYQRDRQYPNIGDQLDMQYHDQLDGTTTWKDAIAKVKSDNPKPE